MTELGGSKMKDISLLNEKGIELLGMKEALLFSQGNKIVRSSLEQTVHLLDLNPDIKKALLDESTLDDFVDILLSKSFHFNEEGVDKDILEKLETRILELEKFVKGYYNCFLDSRIENGIEAPISNNSQFFLYAHANELLGKPNGKRQDM